MRGVIEFVDDEVMPEGHDFILVSEGDGEERLFYRRSAVTPRTLERSWEAYRRLIGVQGPRPPLRLAI